MMKANNEGAQDVKVHAGDGRNGEVANMPRRIVTPPADVLRHADRLTLVLDMPGVDADSLELSFGEQTLRVRGSLPRDAGADATSGVTYAEFELGDYERSFRVGERIETGSISAQLAEGVLTVELPLQKPAHTRIQVRAS